MRNATKALLTVAILTLVVTLSWREQLAQPPRGGGTLVNRVSITTDGNVRRIESNGIPDHQPGQFPNRHNPNTIREQRYDFRVALRPDKAPEPMPLGMNPFGVAVNGVPFDPGAAEFFNGNPDSGWQYEALSGKIDLGLDGSHAHVQPNGAYHYHGVPTALCERLSGGKKQMVLTGYAADGFPMYAVYGYTDARSADSELRRLKPSYQLRKGTRPGGPRGRYDGTFVQDYEYVAESGDLDECNGREGVTPEYAEGTYYYVLTEEYPFIPRLPSRRPRRDVSSRPATRRTTRPWASRWTTRRPPRTAAAPAGILSSQVSTFNEAIARWIFRMHIDKRDGTVSFPNAIVIASSLTQKVFRTIPALANAKIRHGATPSWIHYHFSGGAIDGKELLASACFYDQILLDVSVSACLDPPGANDWSSYSLDVEAATKQFHDRLLEQDLGTPSTGGGLIPGRLPHGKGTLEMPLSWLFHWGHVCSYHDSRGGGMFISVSYGNRHEEANMAYKEKLGLANADRSMA